MQKKKVVLIAFYDNVCISIRGLSAVLKKAGHSPYLIYFKDDRTIIKDSIDDNSKYYQIIINNNFIGCGEDVNPPKEAEFKLLAETVAELNPDIIGISARSVAKELSKKAVTLLREALPDALYIGGGYGPTIEPEIFLEFLDFVCLGEGEQCILDLVESEDLKKVDNIAWLENGKLQYNKLARAVPVDKVPYPDWGFEHKYYIEDEKIIPMKFAYDTKTYDIFASKGCPANCSYCGACQWDSMYSKYNGVMPKIRLRSAESVIEELMFAKETYNIEKVRFMDSIFGFNKRWLFEFLDIYDKKLGLKFFCHLDERFIDEERIKRLKASGLNTTTVGIQSAIEKIRYDIMRRCISDDELVKYAEMLNENGIRIKYDIIGWNPFENNETLGQGVDFLKRFPKGGEVVVFKLEMFPGCPIYSMFREQKPESLTIEEYEYWAWIYQMIIRSQETEKIADFALKYVFFRKNPRILKGLFDEALGKFAVRDKIFAARDIKKGEIMTSMMFEEKESDRKEGVFFNESRRVLSKVVRRDKKKGDLLLWEDFFGAYQNVGGGKF